MKYFDLGLLEFTATVEGGHATVVCVNNGSAGYLEYIEGDGWLITGEDPHFPGVPPEVFEWVERG